MTNNIDLAIPIIDDAFRYVRCYSLISEGTLFMKRITDEEAVAMSRYLVKNDGLFLGSSSDCNLLACVKLAKKKGWRKGQTLVTILFVFARYLLGTAMTHFLHRCDSGNRHYSKVSAFIPTRLGHPDIFGLGWLSVLVRKTSFFDLVGSC
jgi:cysteine synthase A